MDQLFRRQLSIPMLGKLNYTLSIIDTVVIGLEDAYKEYSDWLDCEMDASVSQGHDKALSTLQSLKPYEDALVYIFTLFGSTCNCYAKLVTGVCRYCFR